MTLVVELEEVTTESEPRVGGKAVALAALATAGHAVPPTLVLPTDAYERFVEHASLRAVIHQELGRKPFAEMRWEEIWDAALRIRNRFLRASMPDDLVRTIAEAIRDAMDEKVLAVRSSAPGEDSGSASFAGLHDSFVGVRGVDAAIEAIRKVWASLWSDRALLYRHELGIDIDASAMAVLVQELVEGSVSGIAFAVHPTEVDLAVVEAVYGLNQGLVDGTIQPDRWILERESWRVVDHRPPEERQRMVRSAVGLEVEDLAGGPHDRPPLAEEDLDEVARAIEATEDLFGRPQDIEWTLATRGLVLLQSRPVTTAKHDENDRRPWYLSLTRSLHNLRELRHRVEDELLPELDQASREIGARPLTSLQPEELAAEIELRRDTYDHWVDTYWQEFIPFAHGIRLFGQFYNDAVQPDDPHEFMNLLAGTPMLSLRRNRALEKLAEIIRSKPDLRGALDSGEVVDVEFEQKLTAFEQEYGGAVYADRACFGDRNRLLRLLLTMAEAPARAGAGPVDDAEALAARFLDAVPADRRELAHELLDLGRTSYQLRDDDNLYLGRLEKLVLEAVDEGRNRLNRQASADETPMDLDDVVRGLRHPNLVVEPRAATPPQREEQGFRSLPRQLVGQPAGPGIANGLARIVEDVDDLASFSHGEILVCDAVDPNMTFVVPLASAVVERRGGMLIHGAIIAREYGLPCVTGVPEATAEIATGDRLTVDGFLGIITVVRD
jgi:pyruvate,water dikinase